MNIQPTSGLYSALVIAFFVGLAYNYFVGYLNTTGKSEGYTALLVVGGVLITLVFAAFFIGLDDALITAAFFFATGLPMFIGDISRYIRRREHGRKMLK